MRGCRVMMIPQTNCEGNEDMSVAELVAAGTKAEILAQPDSLTEFLESIRAVDVLVGMRLHSCLLGIISGVPAVSISYLPKCDEIMKDYDLLEWVIDVESVSCDGLINKVDSLFVEENRLRYFERFRAAIRGQASLYKEEWAWALSSVRN